MQQRKNSFLKLQFRDEPIYALGVRFSYDQETANNFFFRKLTTLKKRTLNMWSLRYGRINIVKTLAFSKLVFICSVMESRKHFTQEVNKVTSEFVWNHKPPKVKKTTILKRQETGGLDINDFVIFDKPLKLNWVKRLCLSDHLDTPWRYIPKFYFKKYRRVGAVQLQL